MLEQSTTAEKGILQDTEDRIRNTTNITTNITTTSTTTNNNNGISNNRSSPMIQNQQQEYTMKKRHRHSTGMGGIPRFANPKSRRRRHSTATVHMDDNAPMNDNNAPMDDNVDAKDEDKENRDQSYRNEDHSDTGSILAAAWKDDDEDIHEVDEDEDKVRTLFGNLSASKAGARRLSQAFTNTTNNSNRMSSNSDRSEDEDDDDDGTMDAIAFRKYTQLEDSSDVDTSAQEDEDATAGTTDLRDILSGFGNTSTGNTDTSNNSSTAERSRSSVVQQEDVTVSTVGTLALDEILGNNTGNSTAKSAALPSSVLKSKPRYSLGHSNTSSSDHCNTYANVNEEENKSVVFGSPEYAEYNRTSPSMNVTPLSKVQHSSLKLNAASDEEEEDGTVELEGLTELLHNATSTNTNTSIATPGIDTSSSASSTGTVELEGMTELLQAATEHTQSSIPNDAMMLSKSNSNHDYNSASYLNSTAESNQNSSSMDMDTAPVTVPLPSNKQAPSSVLKAQPRYSTGTYGNTTNVNNPQSASHHHEETRSVVFGSPEYAEYNRTSPSTNVTPLNPKVQQPAGNTPVHLLHHNVEEEDSTVELEGLTELLHNATSTNTSATYSTDSTNEIDAEMDTNTVELEENLTDLLKTHMNHTYTDTHPNTSPHTDEKSIQSASMQRGTPEEEEESIRRGRLDFSSAIPTTTTNNHNDTICSSDSTTFSKMRDMDTSTVSNSSASPVPLESNITAVLHTVPSDLDTDTTAMNTSIRMLRVHNSDFPDDYTEDYNNDFDFTKATSTSIAALNQSTLSIGAASALKSKSTTRRFSLGGGSIHPNPHRNDPIDIPMDTYDNQISSPLSLDESTQPIAQDNHSEQQKEEDVSIAPKQVYHTLQSIVTPLLEQHDTNGHLDEEEVNHPTGFVQVLEYALHNIHASQSNYPVTSSLIANASTSSSSSRVLEFLNEVVLEVEAKHHSTAMEHLVIEDIHWERVILEEAEYQNENNVSTMIKEYGKDLGESNYNNAFRNLVMKLTQYAQEEWMEWEQQVMSYLSSNIDSTLLSSGTGGGEGVNFSAYERDLLRDEALLQSMRRTVEIMESRASKRALEQSLHRRSEQIEQLRGTVEALDSTWNSFEESYTNLLRENNAMSALCMDVQRLNLELMTEEQCRSASGVKFRDFAIQQNMCDVYPIRLDDQRVHLRLPLAMHLLLPRNCRRQFEKHSSHAFVDVIFDISPKSGTVTIDAELVTVSPNNNHCKCTKVPSLMSLVFQSKSQQGQESDSDHCFLEYVDRCLHRIICHVRNTVLDDARDIKSFVQTLVWELGRIELMNRELKCLLAKHDSLLEMTIPTSVLKSNDNNDNFTSFGTTTRSLDFTLTVDFTSKSKPAKIRVCFDVLEDSYPFKPLDVSIDVLIGKEHVDIDALGRQLVKNVSSGYSYMSRACDVITAFMK